MIFLEVCLNVFWTVPVLMHSELVFCFEVLKSTPPEVQLDLDFGGLTILDILNRVVQLLSVTLFAVSIFLQGLEHGFDSASGSGLSEVS